MREIFMGKDYRILFKGSSWIIGRRILHIICAPIYEFVKRKVERKGKYSDLVEKSQSNGF